MASKPKSQQAPETEPLPVVEPIEVPAIEEATETEEVRKYPLTPEEVVQERPVGVYINSEKPELYTIEAYDLNAYPELSQQGVQYGDKVAYNSLWVYKSSTAEGAKDTKSRFPSSTSCKLF